MSARVRAALCLLLLVACSCGTPWFPRYRDTDVYYATSDYEMPIHPKLPMSQAEAMKLSSYLVVHYDGAGRMTAVRKFVDHKRYFLHQYQYDAAGQLIGARITNPDGSVSVLERGPDGTLVLPASPAPAP